MKLNIISEAGPGSFLSRELQNTRVFGNSNNITEEPPQSDQLAAPEVPPGEETINNVNQLPDPTGVPAQPGGNEPVDMTPPASAPPDLDLPLGGGPSPDPFNMEQQPEPMDDALPPESEPETPSDISDQPLTYGNWQEVLEVAGLEGMDNRDRIMEHQPTGLKVRMRRLNVHPNKFLVQAWKGDKQETIRLIIDDDADPIQHILEKVESGLHIEDPDNPPTPEVPKPEEDLAAIPGPEKGEAGDFGDESDELELPEIGDEDLGNQEFGTGDEMDLGVGPEEVPTPGLPESIQLKKK